MNFERRNHEDLDLENPLIRLLSGPILSTPIFQQTLRGRPCQDEDSEEEVIMTSTGRLERSSIEITHLAHDLRYYQSFFARSDLSIFNNLQQNTNQPTMLESFFSLMEQLRSSPEEEIPQGLPKEMIDKIKRMKMGKSCQDCSVCSEGFKKGEKIRKLPCKHIFHDRCILPWFEHKSTCPNCRLNLFDFYQENSDIDV